MSAGCKHLLVICLLGFQPGEGPRWHIFLLPNTTSIWIFPYNLFQGEYRGYERRKRDWDSCSTPSGVFFPSLVNWKTPSVLGNVWYETSSGDVIVAFFFFRALPTMAHNPCTGGWWLLCLAVLTTTTFLGDFCQWFQCLVHSLLQKNWRWDPGVSQDTTWRCVPIFPYWEGFNVSERGAQLPTQTVYCALSGNELCNQGVCLHLALLWTVF